jgi:general secretion pathway protein E
MITPVGLKARFSLETDEIFSSRGCAACRNTGYQGRQAIAEFLTPDTNIQSLIHSRADQQTLEQAAISGGMQTMLQAGMAAVTNGETTVEEVLRVAQSDHL